jgi:DNA-binding transcriptional ArsR family regulator
MGTITLSLPDELKFKMDETDFINWSSIARRAFAETLKDVARLELLRKIREISEISEDDSREIRESIVKELASDVEKVSKDLKSGKLKPKSLKEFNDFCKSL